MVVGRVVRIRHSRRATGDDFGIIDPLRGGPDVPFRAKHSFAKHSDIVRMERRAGENWIIEIITPSGTGSQYQDWKRNVE